MSIGKHTTDAIKIRHLEETIKLKDQELLDVKRECAEQFKKIALMRDDNDLGNEKAKIRKMAEIAKDNFNLLLNDLLDYEDKKIIELPNRKIRK